MKMNSSLSKTAEIIKDDTGATHAQSFGSHGAGATARGRNL
jgi:hypothetical protein